jgi:GT2 family glycosyltransferase
MLAHGMFDERILLMEDVEVAHRLERAGMRLFYLPTAKGQHLHHSRPESLKDRAFALGRSVHELTAYVPAPLVKKRFGMVSTDFGLKWFVKRWVRLVAFLVVDNPLTRFALRLVGGRKSKRSRLTDVYYGLVFRRAFLAGYYRTLLHSWLRPETARDAAS